MRNICSVFKREVAAYFQNPLAYVFIFVFVFLAMVFAFLLGYILERREAALADSFFIYHPWIFMILAPAVGMRLWSEEHRLGTTELLLTMPVRPWHAIVGKYLAACLVIFVSLAATWSISVEVGNLGSPEWGLIFSGYIGSFLIGCTMLAITMAVSAFTRSQVGCLIISVLVCFLINLIGFPMFLDFVDSSFLSSLSGFFSSLGVMEQVRSLNSGLLEPNTFVYFATVIAFCLFTTSVAIRVKRS
jgi:ABC-2 type transport system permease protein